MKIQGIILTYETALSECFINKKTGIKENKLIKLKVATHTQGGAWHETQYEVIDTVQYATYIEMKKTLELISFEEPPGKGFVLARNSIHST